jgi:predicted PurR-regulated permease PerM
MRMLQRILGTTLALALFAPAAWAQQSHTISTSALDQAVQQRVSQDQADRQAIRDLLQGDELHQLASQARTVDQQLAGGVSTIVISTTTIIIVLLLILLIVAIA